METATLNYEDDMLAIGAARYHTTNEQLRTHGLSDYASSKLLSRSLALVAARIKADVATSNNEGNGRTAQWVLPCSALDPDLLAYIGLNVSFTGVSAGWDVRRISKSIGSAIEMEIWASGLKDADPRLFDRIVKRATSRHSTYRYRKNAVTATAAKEGYKPSPWTDEMKLRTGAAILNSVLASSGIFEVYEVTEGLKKTKKLLGFTPEASEEIKGINEVQQWMLPYFKPMPEQPKDWVSYNSGCYHNPKLSARVPLVRTLDKSHQKRVEASIITGECKPVLDALNAIQSVPLRVNTRVLEQVRLCWEANIKVGKMPNKEAIPLPKVPDNWFELSKEEQKLWKRNKEKIILRNRAIDADVANMAHDLATAQSYADMGTFYLPHSLDFRGRVYPVPIFNHQRADHIRAMFEFSNALPLGRSGAWWLGIHLANCGDFEKTSKKPFVDRFQWTLENSEMLCEIAKDPEGTRELWLAADKPFSFLAACFEWEGYCRLGEGYQSRLPIALDGSNSGLQHYSAALRDELGGAYVNLTSTPQPQDVYQAVADLVNQMVSQDQANELAQAWLKFGITRKVVKRNVMTFAYSSEQFGFKQQIIDDLMKPMEDEVLGGHRTEHPFGQDNGRAAAGYLAEKVWIAVNQVVSKAAEGMKFLQKCAQLMAHEAKPLEWTTPVGFPVVHKYEEWDVKRVSMFLHDRKVPVVEATTKDKIVNGEVQKHVVLNLRTKPTGRINKDKQKNAVAPNFIHSLDASHLMLTVLRAKQEGINDFLLIHDSFSTHACNTSLWSLIIRDEFVKMYSQNDVFGTFYQNVLSTIDPSHQSKIPVPPVPGDLDLSEVLLSDYAFS
jgi:DNA-directed RNA polymerase, mitochondrial